MQSINRSVFSVSLIIGIVMIMGLFLWLCGKMKPEIVTFDKTRVVGHFVRQLSQLNLTDPLIADKTKHFKDALKYSLDFYAARHHVVIIAASDVIAGGHDITEALIPIIANSMREKT